jgi:hypothetical protein
MELDELKEIWLSNNIKLEKSVKLNEQSVDRIQALKLTSKLAPLYRQRVIECIFHAAAILILLVFLFKNIFEFRYAASAIVLLSFYAITFLNTLKQIRIIKNMDYSKDLATIQSSLVILQTHMLNYARLTVLFIPTLLAYPVILTRLIRDFHIKALGDFDIITQSHGNWWSAQLIAFIVLVPLGVWFYREVSYKNLQTEWVKKFIQKSSGVRVTKALEFLKELQSQKND